MEFIKDLIIGQFLKFKFLDGYRMYAGGAALVFSGLAIILPQVASGDYNHDVFTKGVTLIGLGLGISGLSGKQDKIALESKER